MQARPESLLRERGPLVSGRSVMDSRFLSIVPVSSRLASLFVPRVNTGLLRFQAFLHTQTVWKNLELIKRQELDGRAASLSVLLLKNSIQVMFSCRSPITRLVENVMG